MEKPRWLSAEVDIGRPSAARIYDYYLGGFHNFAADREVAEQLLRVFPYGAVGARVNRAFLRRAVQFCVAAGVRQFLDLGSGIPTLGNVHEVAQLADPRARVIYVDIDPVAVAHGRTILANNKLAAMIHADLRQPEQVLKDPDLHALLDLCQPVAVMMVTTMHFIRSSDQPEEIVGAYRDAMASGSHLVLSHSTAEGRFGGEQAQHALGELYESSGVPVVLRSREEIIRLFSGFELVEPGLTWIEQWRSTPDGLDSYRYSYGAVGCKP